MQSLLTSLLVGAAAASRANLCFTAHGKTSLQCTQTLLDGPIAVYDDSQSPQKARTYHYSKRVGLCQQKGCKRCMAPGGAWVACGSSAKLPVYVMGANGDWAKPKAIAFAALLVALPIGVFLVLGKPASQRVATSNGSNSESGPGSSVVSFLLRFASAPWFPLVAAFGTAVNMFTIVFTGATVVLFLAAILGRRRSWYITAVANAAGATFGTAILLLLVRERGLDYLNETFPLLLASPAWAKATGLMQTYGIGGMLLVSSLPIILHPVIAFGMLSGMSNATILTIVMSGRTIKYLVMGWVTTNTPNALRFFGIKGALLEVAATATAANAASNAASK